MAFDSELVEATFNHTSMPSLPYGVDSVEVYAIGGGTVGKVYYDQYWAYRVVFLDGSERHGTDLLIPLDANHSRAAMKAAEMLDEEREELRGESEEG